MLLEHGLLEHEPGMEESYTIIPEDMRMNPNCPCMTRTCPNFGFCKYCVEHHCIVDRMLAVEGIETEGVFCKRKGVQ